MKRANARELRRSPSKALSRQGPGKGLILLEHKRLAAEIIEARATRGWWSPERTAVEDLRALRGPLP
jgi:hypothetical protein